MEAITFEKYKVHWQYHNAWNVCSVMQLDRDSFGGDVVLESVNMISRDEDNILDHV